jgi:hypothetical protein
VVWDALLQGGPAVADAALDGHTAAAVLGAIQLVLLVLPWAGAILIFWMMGRQLIRAVRGYWHRRRTMAAGSR